jgi:hypothetical protein
MDVWWCAEHRALVIAGVHGEKRLDDNYAIKPCPPDSEETTSPSIDLFAVNKLTWPCLPPGGPCSRGGSLQQLAGTRGFYHC